MASITLPPFPSSGQPLLDTVTESNPDDAYTASIHRGVPILAASDDGLMSVSNGWLSASNLSSGFRVGAEHIMPEQAVVARSETMSSTSTIYANGVAVGGDEIHYFTLPGASLRWYQPYDVSFALMQWSLFTSFNCWRGVYKDKHNTKQQINTPIRLRCVLDGSAIEGTNRRIGQNMFHPVAPGHESVNEMIGPGTNFYDDYISRDRAPPYPGGNPQYVFTEAHSAVPFDMHHGAALSRGYHEISVQCAMQLAEGEAVYVQNIGTEKRSYTFRGRGYFNLTGKISLGIRNARVLALL